MGPQLFSRGYIPYGSGTAGGLYGCFNGATAFQPWIQDCFGILDGAMNPLQWGHSFSAVDTASNTLNK